MKPTSYRNLPAYGQAIAAEQSQAANSPQAVKTVHPAMIEAEFYKGSMDRALQLGYMGLQKEMFSENLEENKRQFDTGLGESKRQFGISMNFARDQFKYARRQDNRAELLAMSNVGLGLGMGYLQYKQARNTLTMQKQQMAKIDALLAALGAKQKKKEVQE